MHNKNKILHTRKANILCYVIQLIPDELNQLISEIYTLFSIFTVHITGYDS